MLKPMKLSDKDRQILAAGFESEFYRVFKKHFMEERQMVLAQQAPFQSEMSQIYITRGAIMELRNMHKDLQTIHAKQAKKESQKS